MKAKKKSRDAKPRTDKVVLEMTFEEAMRLKKLMNSIHWQPFRDDNGDDLPRELFRVLGTVNVFGDVHSGKIYKIKENPYL